LHLYDDSLRLPATQRSASPRALSAISQIDLLDLLSEALLAWLSIKPVDFARIKEVSLMARVHKQQRQGISVARRFCAHSE